MRRLGVVSASLLLAACGELDPGSSLPARRYTFASHPSSCDVVVLDVEPDGSASLRLTGVYQEDHEPVVLERRDAEVVVSPADDADTLELLDASSAILRRTSCARFDVTLVRAYGPEESSLFAADPCIEEIPPPENGDEWDQCRLRYCNDEPC